MFGILIDGAILHLVELLTAFQYSAVILSESSFLYVIYKRTDLCVICDLDIMSELLMTWNMDSNFCITASDNLLVLYCCMVHARCACQIILSLSEYGGLDIVVLARTNERLQHSGARARKYNCSLQYPLFSDKKKVWK